MAIIFVVVLLFFGLRFLIKPGKLQKSGRMIGAVLCVLAVIIWYFQTYPIK